MKGQISHLCAMSVAAALLFSAPAAARPLAQVRFSNLQAALADVATVAAAAGKPDQGQALLSPLLAQMGINDLELLDPTRPLAAVLPLEGMLLQQRGVVVALPVTSAARLLDGVAPSFSGRSRDGALEVFSDLNGPVLYAEERDGYVVIGQTRDFVIGFDLGMLSEPWDGPPGSVVAELYLEPLVPLLRAGLTNIRAQARQQLQQGAGQPRNAPLGTPPVDTGAVAELADLYFDALQSVLADLSRLQIGLEVRSEHLLVHNRLVPRPGTATAEFVAQQRGGLPSLGRVVGPGVVSMTGQVQLTPQLYDGLARFVRGYLRAARRVLGGGRSSAQLEEPESVTESAARFTALDAYLADVEGLLVEAIPCFTGEMAAAMDFSVLEGMNIAEVVGIVDTPKCRALTSRSLAKLRSLANGAAPVGIEFDGEELVHGVQAQRFTVDLGVAEQQLDAQEMQTLRLLYGGTKVTSYVAAVGGATYYAVGASARVQLQGMLAASGGSARSGIQAGTFAPLTLGPGVFASVNVQRVLGFARDLMPPDNSERAQLEQLVQLFAGPNSASRIAVGLRFDPGGGTFQLAVPLKVLGTGQQLEPLPVKGEGGG